MGIITNGFENTPAQYYPVSIHSNDSSSKIITYTDDYGFYIDSIPVETLQPITVSVVDCFGFEQSQKFNNPDFINFADFNICVKNTGCQASFKIVPDSNNYLQINFINTSQGDYSFVKWEFGNGDFSYEENPSYTFDKEGFYKITLSVFDTSYWSYCYNTTFKLIYVGKHCNLNAAFSYEPDTSADDHLTYRFYDISEGDITSWYWDFGDGNTSIDQNPVHTYQSPGTYYTTLIIEDSLFPCIDSTGKHIKTAQYFSFTGKVTDSVTQQPVNHYLVNLYSAIYNKTYQAFTNTEGIYAFDSIIFIPDDMITVSLYDCNSIRHFITFDTLRKVNIANFEICTIEEVCAANFTFFLDTINNTPNYYNFFDKSEGNIAQWHWQFGDGNSSEEKNPVHIYQEHGNYTVTLSVSNITGSYCDTISYKICTPNYYDLGGQVFLDNFPININPGDSSNKAVAYLFRKVQNSWHYMDKCEFYDLGYYWFTQKLEGEYLIRIDLKNSSEAYNDYAPSYYKNQINWHFATPLFLNETAYQESIWLTPLTPLPSGTAKISGHITNMTNDSLADSNVLVQLFNSSDNIVRYTYTDKNSVYQFNNIPDGTYTIRAEHTGYCSNEPLVNIQNGSSVYSVELSIVNCETFGIKEINKNFKELLLYPVPAFNFITIKTNNNLIKDKIEIIDITGRTILTKNLNLTTKEITINIGNIEQGIYILKLYYNKSTPAVKKLIISH
jgi:PKD repeat protein